MSEKTEEVSRRVALTVWRMAKDFLRCGQTSVYKTGQRGGGVIFPWSDGGENRKRQGVVG